MYINWEQNLYVEIGKLQKYIKLQYVHTENRTPKFKTEKNSFP